MSGTLILAVASMAVLVLVAALAWRAADRAVGKLVEPPASPGPDPGSHLRRSSANATPGQFPGA